MRDYRTVQGVVVSPPSRERGKNLFTEYNLIDPVISKMLYEKSVQQPWNGLLDAASSNVTDTRPCNPKELPKLKKEHHLLNIPR